jgi:hypothetical protein
MDISKFATQYKELPNSSGKLLMVFVVFVIVLVVFVVAAAEK